MNSTIGKSSSSAKGLAAARPSVRPSASSTQQNSSASAFTPAISSKHLSSMKAARPDRSRFRENSRPHAGPSSGMMSKGGSENINLNEIHDQMIAVAQKAGQRILDAKTAAGGVETKKSSVDLVTETDRAVESIVSGTLMKRYPDFEFVGEETFEPGKQLSDKPTFVCDPIDGTTNFVHQYPCVAISLGLVYKKESVIGVVYNPFTGQLYTGIKDQGSYLTDIKGSGKKSKLPSKQPLEPLTKMSDLLIILEWGSEREGPNYEIKRKTYDNLIKSDRLGGAMVQSWRSFGCASLDLCYVASGSIDAYWDGGPWLWDFCAGTVIVKEAGGIVVDANPGRWEIPADHRTILAVRPSPQGGNAKGQKGIVKDFWRYVAGRFDYRP